MDVARRDFLPRPELEKLQFARLRELLGAILPHNRFHARRLGDVDPGSLRTPADLQRLPLLTKQELLADQREHPLYGSLLTFPPERYCRVFQTSGTSGQPLRWLDTPESMGWMHDCWRQILDVAGVTKRDRLFFPFSFGPFLGFWTAFEAAARLGYFLLPGGGMSSLARLRFLLDHQATVVFCTPSYALHLVETARREGIDLAGSLVRLVIVAGEPGGSIPATRSRIEAGWGARVLDHSGMTEIGPCAIECIDNPAGLHLLEADYLAEVIDPQSLAPVPAGQRGELVLTNLGRVGSPLIRYRTGDLVQADPAPCPCGRTFLRLVGGILGRADDMIHLRGNNVHPSSLEAIIRRFDQVAEYRIAVDRSQALASLRIEVEPLPGVDAGELTETVAQAIRDELLFRADIQAVPPGSLPRYEMKARRVIHT